MANVKYNKNKPKELLEAMKKGHSFTGALGEIGIGKTQGFSWVKKYPEFAKAKEEGHAHALNFIEKCAISALLGFVPPEAKMKGSKQINVTMAIFLMKTRFHKEYGERMRIQEQVEHGLAPTIIRKLNGDTIELGAEKKNTEE